MREGEGVALGDGLKGEGEETGVFHWVANTYSQVTNVVVIQHLASRLGMASVFKAVVWVDRRSFKMVSSRSRRASITNVTLEEGELNVTYASVASLPEDHSNEYKVYARA